MKIKSSITTTVFAVLILFDRFGAANLLRKGPSTDRELRSQLQRALSLPSCHNGEIAVRVPDIEIGDLGGRTFADDVFNQEHGVEGVEFSTDPNNYGFAVTNNGNLDAEYYMFSEEESDINSPEFFTHTFNSPSCPQPNFPQPQVPCPPVRVDFADPVSEVWVDMGDDLGDEADNTFSLVAYNSMDNIVDSDEYVSPAASNDFHRMTVRAESISYVIFEGNEPSNLNNFFFDKFTFCPKTSCPNGCDK